MMPFYIEHSTQPEEAAEPPTPAEIPGLIEVVMTAAAGSDPEWVACRRLRCAGRRAESALLAALDDPRATWDEPPSGSDEPMTPPGARLAWVLDRLPSRALGDKLFRLLDHPGRSARLLAPTAVAALGRADLLSWVVAMLSRAMPSKEDSVAGGTVRKGVDRSLRLGWAEPAFVTGMLEWAKAAAFNPNKQPSRSWAMKFYARHGGAEALEILQRPDVLSLDNNHCIEYVLRELARHRIAIPETQLAPFIAKAVGSQSWPWEYAFGPALRVLALSNADAAMKLALERIESEGQGSEVTLRHATEFIREHHGLPTWSMECFPPAGMALTAAEEDIVESLWDCVRSKSAFISDQQRFEDEFGPLFWIKAHQAFKTVGMTASARLIMDAASILDPHGAAVVDGQPPVFRTDLSEHEQERLTTIRHEIYDEWSREVAVTRYLLRHKDLFVRIRQAQIAAGFDQREPGWDDGRAD